MQQGDETNHQSNNLGLAMKPHQGSGSMSLVTILYYNGLQCR